MQQKVRDGCMYRILTQLEDGELLYVACRNQIVEAVELIEGLNTHWPREYIVLDSEGNDVDLTRCTAMEPARRPATPAS
jgi:hypothetical protein